MLKRSLIIGCLATLCLGTGPVRADEAQRILDEADVRGGLVVHLGCADGRLTVSLRLNERFVVQGLATDERSVREARQHFRDEDVCGSVSAARIHGRTLPYVDNLVRLAVVEQGDMVPMSEVMRVLCPGGVAMIKGDDGWQKTVKPRPAELDVWTQHLHGADGNPVSGDLAVGPPRHAQWMAPPRYFRTHAKDPGLHLMLATEDKVFYNLDEGPIGVIDPRLEEKWSLVARDAYSGVLLWKRPLTKWNFRHWEHLAPKMNSPTSNWSAPLSLRRRLVADGDRLYGTLSYPEAMLQKLDAETGETLRVFPHTEGTDEIVLDGDMLVLRLRSFPGWTDQPMRYLKDLPPETVMGLDVESGNVLWEVESAQLAPLTLAAKSGRVCFRTFQDLVCLDAQSGREMWRVACLAKASPYDAGSGGALVMWGDAVLVATKSGVQVYSLEDGSRLWQDERLNIGGFGFMSPMSLLVADGLLWNTTAGSGYDPLTGELARKIELGKLFETGHHTRCYREKATERYIIYPRRGLEFVDLHGDDHSRNDWTRGACGFGIMPANGLLYVPPNPCHCYSGSLVAGLNAFAATREQISGPVSDGGADRLQKGPAYGRIQEESAARADDWPMYRHDPARSGATPAALGAPLAPVWRAELSGDLTPPVLADGRVFIAVKDRHAVQCLDAAGGRSLWRYTTGAPVDSSPTVAHGRVIFGCTDGWLYVLRASDGALAWRFRAAPEERRMMVYGHLQSPWPVHGSVLVRDGIVYCTAGRSSYLDGGLYVYGLDLATGKVVHADHLDGPRVDAVAEAGRGHYLEGANGDLLTVDEAGDLNMVHVRWDADLTRQDNPLVTEDEVDVTTQRPWMKERHTALMNLSGLRKVPRRLMATNGFLEDAENPRTYQIYGRYWPGFNNPAPDTPGAGRIVCVESERVYALKIYRKWGNCSPFFTADDGTQVVCDTRQNEADLDLSHVGQARAFGRSKPPVWSVMLPMRGLAMISAAETLAVAGPPDALIEGETLAPFEGRAGGRLAVLAKDDGRTLCELQLDSPPVFDGMATAGGRLYISLENGEVLCLAAR